MKVKAIKLSSEDLINYPLLEHVAGLRRKTILSTGMADQKEVDAAVSIFKTKKTKLVKKIDGTKTNQSLHRETLTVTFLIYAAKLAITR